MPSSTTSPPWSTRRGWSGSPSWAFRRAAPSPRATRCATRTGQHLVVYGGYARGRRMRDLTPEQQAEADVLDGIVRVGWGRSDAVFRRVFTARFLPGAAEEQMARFDEMMRVSATADAAQRLRAVWAEIDIRPH